MYFYKKKNTRGGQNTKNETQKTKHKTRGIVVRLLSMLQSFPPYAVHSAMHFQDSGYFPAKGAAGKKNKPKSTRVESAGEEEEYVFV